jgi:hypothetical protein
MWTLHRNSPQTRISLHGDSGEVEFEPWLDIRLHVEPMFELTGASDRAQVLRVLGWDS